MTKKKRHHYVPKFYLRRFSINEEGKFLRLYNLNNRKFVQNAPLKNQAYENFLYGEDDEIENALADMEGNISQLFNIWTDEKQLYPPPPESNAFKLLKQFILYQAYRTPKSGNDLMSKINEGIKTVIKEFKPDLWDKIKDGTLAHENPVLYGLSHAIEHQLLLNYLDCKFLVNLSLFPFITSIPFHAFGPDRGTQTCPVCKYGRYHGIIYFVGNNTNWNEVKSWLQFLEQESKNRKKYLKVYFVYGNDKDYNKDQRQSLLEKLGSQLNIQYTALTFVPSFYDEKTEAVLNKINPQAENTFVIYKHRNIVDKYINLKPTKESFKMLSNALDKTQGDFFDLSEPDYE